MIANETEHNPNSSENPEQKPTEQEAAAAVNEVSEEQRKRELEDIKTMLHIRELESKVKTFETKFADIREYVKKMEGEIESIRQRAVRDTQRTIDQRIGEFFGAILGISDNFELSVKNATGDTSPLADGVRMIHSQFSQFLQTAGLERLSPKGEVFDPHQHEAICTQPTDIKEMDNVVLQEVKPGYRYKSMTLRPAQVVVGRFHSSENSNSAS